VPGALSVSFLGSSDTPLSSSGRSDEMTLSSDGKRRKPRRPATPAPILSMQSPLLSVAGSTPSTGGRSPAYRPGDQPGATGVGIPRFSLGSTDDSSSPKSTGGLQAAVAPGPRRATPTTMTTGTSSDDTTGTSTGTSPFATIASGRAARGVEATGLLSSSSGSGAGSGEEHRQSISSLSFQTSMTYSSASSSPTAARRRERPKDRRRSSLDVTEEVPPSIAISSDTPSVTTGSDPSEASGEPEGQVVLDWTCVERFHGDMARVDRLVTVATVQLPAGEELVALGSAIDEEVTLERSCLDQVQEACEQLIDGAESDGVVTNVAPLRAGVEAELEALRQQGGQASQLRDIVSSLQSGMPRLSQELALRWHSMEIQMLQMMRLRVMEELRAFKSSTQAVRAATDSLTAQRQQLSNALAEAQEKIRVKKAEKKAQRLRYTQDTDATSSSRGQWILTGSVVCDRRAAVASQRELLAQLRARKEEKEAAKQALSARGEALTSALAEKAGTREQYELLRTGCEEKDRLETKVP
jgi:hypothetical protein